MVVETDRELKKEGGRVFYCPLMSNKGLLMRCLGVDCALFDVSSNSCSILQIAKGLASLDYELERLVESLNALVEKE
jgi:hypothetical protein